MQKVLEETRDNILKIRGLIEKDEIPEEVELLIFREEPGVIIDLIHDLNDAISESALICV